MKLKADAGVKMSFKSMLRVLLSALPASTEKVLTTDSLEEIPVRRAAVALQSPKPIGAKIGANSSPMRESRLLFISDVR